MSEVNQPSMEIWPGQAYPLGSTYDGAGTNFALFSDIADKVELCLLDSDNTETRIELTEVDANIWHAYLPGIQPGLRGRARGVHAALPADARTPGRPCASAAGFRSRPRPRAPRRRRGW